MRVLVWPIRFAITFAGTPACTLQLGNVRRGRASTATLEERKARLIDELEKRGRPPSDARSRRRESEP